jgi:spore coat polysaccharide biosynthesis predicted glycosyltransferase SpsG
MEPKNTDRVLDLILGQLEKLNISQEKLSQEIQKINIVIGAAYPFKEKLTEKVKTSNKHIQLFSNLSELEMIDLITNCDAAFAPCSTTCMEAFAINKPVFAGFSALNQIDLYNYFKTNGLIFDLKNLQEISVKEIKDLVEEKAKHIPEINKMLNLQRQLIDGRSGERIVALIKKLVE